MLRGSAGCCVQPPIAACSSQEFCWMYHRASTEPQGHILARGRQSQNPSRQTFWQEEGSHGIPKERKHILARGRNSRRLHGNMTRADPQGVPAMTTQQISFRRSRKHMVAKEKGLFLARRVWHENLARRVWHKEFGNETSALGVWHESLAREFGTKSLARRVWHEEFGTRVLHRGFGTKSLARRVWRHEEFCAKSLARRVWRE